jgi:hypothetical protein
MKNNMHKEVLFAFIYISTSFLGLQILDTCSNSNKAVKATMKGLVSAEQTCIKPPLLLGLIELFLF